MTTEGYDGGRRVLVLVTGSARSGTSSLAGSLDKLGLHVPRPVVRPGPINPKGFFETTWVVDFHKAHLQRIGVHGNDSSPRAAARVEGLLRDGRVTAELEEWLGRQREPVIVLKDNQIRWFLPAWFEVADRLEMDARVLTSIRHPAEVVGSRDLAWGQDRDRAERIRLEVANTAVWLNVALQTEVAARGHTRAFLRYTDLLDDWRGTLGRAADQLHLAVEVPAGPHELDSWLEADLRHSRLTWDDIAGPSALKDLAEDTWRLLNDLVEAPEDEAAHAGLDRNREAYSTMYAESVALVASETEHAVREAVSRSTRRLRERVERLQARLARQQGLNAELTERVRASVPVPRAVADRLRTTRSAVLRARRR